MSISKGQGNGKYVLVTRKSFPLLQIGSRAENAIDTTSYYQGSGRSSRAFSVDRSNFGRERGEKVAGDGIPGSGVVECEDADEAGMGSRVIGDVDDGGKGAGRPV